MNSHVSKMETLIRGNRQPITSRWVSATGIFAVLLGLTVLIGWTWDISVLKSVLPGLIAMKANTAVSFMLVGAALCLLVTRGSNRTRRWMGCGAAGLTVLLAVVILSQDVFGWDLGIDQLLFREPSGTMLTTHPGRMSPFTAVNFFVLGLALLLMEFRRAYPVVQGLALFIGMVSLVPLVGYLFGHRTLPFLPRITPVAAHTALGFLVLVAGLLTATAGHSFLVRVRARLPAFGFGFAIVLLAVAGLASFLNTRRMMETNSRIEHTLQILERLQMIEGNLSRVAAAARGFVMTGD